MYQEKSQALSRWLTNPALMVLIVLGGSTVRGGHYLGLWLFIHAGLLVFAAIKVGGFKLNQWIGLYGALSLLGLISLLWAYDMEMAWAVASRMLTAFLAIWIVFASLKNPQEMELFFKSFCTILIFLTITTLVGGGMEEEAEFLFGSKNTVGPLAFTLLATILVLLALKSRIFIFAIPLPFAAILWSTSLKTVLSLCVFILLIGAFTIFDYRRLSLVVKTISLSIVIIFAATQFIDITRFIPAYERIEYRVRLYADDLGLIESDTNEIVRRSQVDLRANLVTRGFDYFKESPVLGHGANQFRILYGRETGFFTYSHNTFIELLVGFGLIGIILFLAFLWIFFKAVRQHRKDIVSPIVIAYLVSFLFLGNGQEIFYNVPFLLMLTASLRYFQINEEFGFAVASTWKSNHYSSLTLSRYLDHG